jgi:hypothetical protein
MKQTGLLIYCTIIAQLGYAQSVDWRELNLLLDLSSHKVEAHLLRKGYHKTYMETHQDEPALAYQQTQTFPDHTYTRCFKILENSTGNQLLYSTTSPQEDSLLLQELKMEGFSSAVHKKEEGDSGLLFQKLNICIEHEVCPTDSSPVYQIKAEKKLLPKPKDIAFAEDLLKLESHEQLVAVLGKENVKKDIFYYSETETNKCTVIYPNTNKEAIYIWKDEDNYKDIAFVIIGGNLKNQQNTDNVNQILHNMWRSRQGIYCGMNLIEVQQLNKAAISFYNWRTESAGYLTARNKGNIDFNRIKFILNCLNCTYVKNDHGDVIQSDEAIEENQKIYITTYVLLPEKSETSNTELSNNK